MTCESPEKMRARAERNGYKNGTKYGSLESQINYDPRFKGILPTPQTSDCQGALTPEQKEKYVEKWKAKGIIPSASYQLRQQAVEGLLPTPMAVDVHHATRVEELRAKGATMHSRANGDSRPNGLTDYLHFNGILPTPTARDEKNPSSPDGKRIARKKEQGWTIELSDLAAIGNLPTPSARDWKGKTNPGQIKEGSGCVYGETLPDAVERIMKDGLLPTPHAGIYKTAGGSEEYWEKRKAKGHQEDLSMKVYDAVKDCDQAKDGQIFRLSPLFTEEMMGFPLGWTTFPFLSENGEPSPLKPTATQSSRKSCTESSKQ